MADRPLDRLLPGALALVLGVGALAAGLAGIAADVLMGRPSAASGVGFVLMLPIVILAAILGYAGGYGVGAWLKGRGLTPQVAMGPYRVVMAFVLGVATVIGATFGARPVIRHERSFTPRVIMDAHALIREVGVADGCSPRVSVAICDMGSGVREGSVSWNGREVNIACERDRIRITDSAGAVVASANLPGESEVHTIRASTMRLPQGREALALLAAVGPLTRRYLFTVFDADGRPSYQELFAGDNPHGTLGGIYACKSEEAPGVVVDLGGPVTFRPR